MSAHAFETEEAVGDALGMPHSFQAILTVGRSLLVTVNDAQDLDELTAALTARRDELAQWDARFQVPVIVQVPDAQYNFRSVFHEWKEVAIDEMLRRGWHPSWVQAAARMA